MSLKEQTIFGFSWLFLQKTTTQSISFLTTIILARLILPEEFGLIGMISIFIGIGNVLLDAGFSTSLIRCRDVDQKDYSTVFYFNIVASVFLYLTIFCLAPYIASFFNQSILTPIVRVYSLSFIITAFSSIQNAMLIKNMKFKTLFSINLPSSIISSIIGISLAFLEFGVWSLVWSGVGKTFFYSIQLWMHNRWKPLFTFDKQKFKYHFNFGSKLMINEVLNCIFVNIYPILIGKFYTSSQVAYYTQSESLKQIPTSNIQTSVATVTYPLFSKIQNDDQKLATIYTKVTTIILFIIAPILIYMSILSEPLLTFLYSDKWSAAAPFLSILCYAAILPSINIHSINILKAKGSSSLLLKIETTNKIILLLMIVIFFKFGIYGLIWSKVISSVFSFFINSYFCGKSINLNLWSQIKTILPILTISIVSGIVVYFVNNIFDRELNNFLNIMLSSVIGLLSYIILIYIFERNLFKEFKTIISLLRKQ